MLHQTSQDNTCSKVDIHLSCDARLNSNDPRTAKSTIFAPCSHHCQIICSLAVMESTSISCTDANQPHSSCNHDWGRAGGGQKKILVKGTIVIHKAECDKWFRLHSTLRCSRSGLTRCAKRQHGSDQGHRCAPTVKKVNSQPGQSLTKFFTNASVPWWITAITAWWSSGRETRKMAVRV